jgi:hypothetical protein
MRGFATENAPDIESLCHLLDIGYDDIVKCFPDKLVRAYPTYFPSDESYEETPLSETE